MSYFVKDCIELALDDHLQHDQVNREMIIQRNEKENANNKCHEGDNNYTIKAIPLNNDFRYAPRVRIKLP